MSGLAEQKRLLLAESELNRELLAKDLTSFTGACDELAGRAFSIGVLGASLVRMAASFTQDSRDGSTKMAARPSLLQRIISMSQTGMQLWDLWQTSRRSASGP